MKFYLAPMEGLTGYIFRNALHTYFNHVDKYFSPFISANQRGLLKTREVKDISPENNQGLVLVPQILTNKAEDFILTAKEIKLMGYNEVNLNLGCPSGTVVSKHKGSGFLAKTKELDIFLEEIFSRAETKISVKTRIGKDHPEEFYELIEIFNKYPIDELTIHPRTQKDLYKNKCHPNIFKEALGLSKNPLCYNGDMFTLEDFKKLSLMFPSVESIMVGRGIIANPALIHGIKNQEKPDKALLKAFHDKIYNDYKESLFGEVPVLHKMKALWFYMICVFSESDKYWKKIKKASKLYEYEGAVSSLFREQDVLDNYESQLVFRV